MTAPCRHLFGPVPSRRLGRSLGIDLTPRKTCTQDCVFCQVAPTDPLTAERREWVPTDEILAEWDRWKASGGTEDVATLSGSGEPTLHTRFGDILRRIRRTGAPKTALFTNGTLLHLPEVRRGAAEADLVKITLSAPDEETFRRIHRPAPGITLAKLVEGARLFRAGYPGTVWLEIMLLPGWNDAPAQLRALAALARTIRPDAIDLNTAIRPPLAGLRIPPLSPEALAAAAPLFDPPARIPPPPREPDYRLMPDGDLLRLLARHPVALGSVRRAYAAAPAGELPARIARLRLRTESGFLCAPAP